jgi:hypothetical protein
MLLAEHLLDALDEIRLLIEGAPGDDEGPFRRFGLLLYLLQAPGAEVHPARREEGVGAVSHGIMVLPCEASRESDPS